MKSSKRFYLFIAAGLLLAGLIAVLVMVLINSQHHGKRKPITAGATLVTTPPAPFLHRPFYGNLSVSQRTVSFVDHDKPWYVHDNVFIRYDGKRWDNTPIGACSAGVNCYDGHNGYDLNMWFEPVLSAAPGKVIRANWYNPLNHNDSLGLWVAIDHGNGIATAYGHLSAITVAIGDQVGTQWQIGTTGTTGSSTGPHLHMATYYLPNWQATDPFGWTGSYADPNIVPDRNLWVSNAGTSVTIPNLGVTGNQVYPGATLVDDGAQGWTSTGTWTPASAATDVNGDLHWTKTTASSSTALSTWSPDLPGDGYYEVAAFIDDNHASSSWAPYTVYSTDPSNTNQESHHTVYIDQSHIGLFQGPFGPVDTGARWVSLGTYYFKKAMHGRVVLSNATGENGLELAADAVEFVPVNASLSQPSIPTYSFAVTSAGTPPTLAPGSLTRVTVNVKNTGSVTWPASGTSRVTLGYYWQDSAGNSVAQTVAGSTVMSTLPADVKAGASASVPLSLRTPLLPGNYQLVYDLQIQGKWFSALGAKPATSKVTVLPSLPRTYYFAEGNTTNGANERLTLTNFAATQATITITYYFPNAAPQTRSYQVAAQSSSVLTIANEIGTGKYVSMMVQGDQPFLAERSVQTPAGSLTAAATTVSSGAVAPASNWYFAQANTTYGWNTSLAVLNPSTRAVQLTVKYHSLQPRSPVTKTSVYTIPARARFTVGLNGALPNQQFGMTINASGGVVIEKVEYLIKSPHPGGSALVGATTPQKTWYFGGGNTTAGFTEALVLANPSNTAATTRIAYLTAAGKTVVQSVTLPAQRSIEVNVNSVVKQALHATSITASAPIVAERQDFFDTSLAGRVSGSMAMMGSSGLHSSWYLPSGDSSAGHAQSLALANPGSTAAQVQIVYSPASGTPLVKSYTLAANSRQTISLASEVGQNQSVSFALYASVPIVVEQTMFFNVNGASGGYADLAYGT